MNHIKLKFKQLFLSTHIGKIIRSNNYRKYYTRENAIKAIEHFGLEINEELINDILNEALLYDVTFSEYFMYHFYELSNERRREFIPLREAQSKYIEKVNSYKHSKVFFDKSKTYSLFSDFYHRKLILLRNYSHSEYNSFMQFYDGADKIIVKPYDGAEGHGIKIINKTIDIKGLFYDIKKDYPNGAVIENVVIQDQELSILHPESINTLRIGTIRSNDDCIVLPLVLRCGIGNSIVDNGGSGGIICALDENGVVTNTSDEKGFHYEYHPTTNQKLIGFKVPRINEAILLAKQLSAVYPKVKYVGWDLALSKDGWVMIEGNSDASFVLWQVPKTEGCRKMMDLYFKNKK